MQNIDAEIRSKTEAFVTNLTALVRQAALESVSAALGGPAGPATPSAHTPARAHAPVVAPVKRGRGRPRKIPLAAPVAAKAPLAAKPAPAPAKAAPAAKPVVARKGAPKRPFGAKRPPAELAKLTEKLGEYIKSHPGLRIEPIGAALGAPTKELSLPIKKLLAGKKIRSEGHKRATEYYPA